MEYEVNEDYFTRVSFVYNLIHYHVNDVYVYDDILSYIYIYFILGN